MAQGRSGTHKRILTLGGKATAELPQFRALNTALSHLTTGQAGTCHAFKFANHISTPTDVAEFQCRLIGVSICSSTHRRFAHAACTTKPHSLGAIRG